MPAWRLSTICGKHHLGIISGTAGSQGKVGKLLSAPDINKTQQMATKLGWILLHCCRTFNLEHKHDRRNRKKVRCNHRQGSSNLRQDTHRHRQGKHRQARPRGLMMLTASDQALMRLPDCVKPQDMHHMQVSRVDSSVTISDKQLGPSLMCC